MVGLVMLGEKKTLERRSILGLSVWALTVEKSRHEAVTLRRLRRGLRQLKRLGVRQVLVEHGFPYRELLGREGLYLPDTRPLRLEIAPQWLRKLCPGRETTVAVTAEGLTPQVVQVVTELCLRYRHVILEVPRGGEELGRRLRRQYGVALQTGGRWTAEAVVQCSGGGREGRTVTLRLWDEGQALPRLRLGEAQEAALPRETERGLLLAALLREGKAGEIWVE